MSWTATEYQHLVQDLQRQRDGAYQQFNEKTIAEEGGARSIGVRMPVLRALSKQIARREDWREFLAVAQDKTHEEVLLQGMVIGLAAMPYAEKLGWIGKYVPKIRNWAQCDCFVNQQMLKKNRADFWPGEVDRYLRDENPWAQRFAYIVMMTYYLDEEHIEGVLARVQVGAEEGVGGRASKHYYVQMGVAWLLATAMVKQRAATKEFLERERARLGTEVRKMTVRKIRDSYRVSKADKDWAWSVVKGD